MRELGPARTIGSYIGFVSAEEVGVMADLPPALTPQIAEYGLFLR